MRVQITDQTGKAYTIDIDPTDNIFQLKGKYTRQAGGGNVHKIKVFFNGKELDNFSNLIQNQIKEGDTLTAQAEQAAPPQPKPVPQQNFFGGGGFQTPQAAAPQNFMN